MRLPNPHKCYNWRFLYTKVFSPAPSKPRGVNYAKAPKNLAVR
nr:MAG TPA: hypothetical protein [Caudoviricetes sp.]